jgi:hypothetical protein
MPAKEKPTNVNTNTNNNTNNVNVKVNVERPKKAIAKKTSSLSWLKKTIIGGIIALLLSVTGYYIKKQLDNKGGANSEATK